MSTNSLHSTEQHDPYSALRIPDYRLFLGGNFLANIALQMQDVAAYWEIWNRTGSAMSLALVGLVQVLPVIALALPAGHVADRFSRRRIVMFAQAVIAAGSLGLALNASRIGHVQLIYGLLFVTGLARAFQQPARASLMPQIVPRERFSNAVTWSTSAFQLASVLGPALGGVLIGAFNSPAVVYLMAAGGTASFFIALSLVRGGKAVASSAPVSLRSLLGGAEFVYGNKLILAAITLDMFAVLLGGATALLPMYAQILGVGAVGFGAMRAAPFVGALLMSFVLAHRRPLERSGRDLLWSVAGFGIATIVFGISRNFWLSMVMLFLTGALDAISVVVRHTLVQLLTPDEMRGRVSAINGLFISISNEMGSFESGFVAAVAHSATFSVVSGGIGTVVVVAMVALVWPQLGRYGRLGSIPGERPAGGFPVLTPPTVPAVATVKVECRSPDAE